MENTVELNLKIEVTVSEPLEQAQNQDTNGLLKEHPNYENDLERQTKHNRGNSEALSLITTDSRNVT